MNLDTHIDDVVNLIRWEELSDVVLCGHSYGGCVISGVADRMPERIRALVYLDAFVLEDGQSLHDTLPAARGTCSSNSRSSMGKAGRCRRFLAEVFNVNAGDRAWVNRQCTMQPLATFQQAIKLTGRSAPRSDHVHPGHRLERFPVPRVLRAGEGEGLEDAHDTVRPRRDVGSARGADGRPARLHTRLTATFSGGMGEPTTEPIPEAPGFRVLL